MDETKGSSQDSLQATGQTSGADKGSTSQEPKTKTYTEEEVQKIKSDALAAAGRDAKTLENLRKQLEQREESLKAMQAEIEQWKQSQETILLEAIKRNPDAIEWHKERQKLQEERKAFQKQEEERRKADLEKDSLIKALQEEVARGREAELEMRLYELGAQYRLNPTSLKDIMKKLGLTTVEQAEELAKELAVKKEAGKPDSLMTSGAGKSLEGKSSHEIFADYFRSKTKK